MCHAAGFLGRVFSCFEKFDSPLDHIFQSQYCSGRASVSIC
jgi:hypothetical protein